MTRVLLICGSLQRVSSNRAALDAARARILELGAQATTFDELASIPPMNPDRGDDPGESVLALRAGIGASDAVLIAAPEYAGAVAGVVKNALDWIVGSGELHGKPVALLAAGTTGGVHARKDLVRTLAWQGAHVVASLGIAGPKSKSVVDPGGASRLTDAETLKEIGELARSLLDAVGQSPLGRWPAVERLLADAGVESSPLAAQMGALAEER